MIVSTGMNDLNSVNKAVEILRDSNVDFALLLYHKFISY